MNTSDYLRNLNQWQVGSHPELANRKPEELFGAGFAERYNRLHEHLWARIIRVHGTLYTLEQLEQFPFGYLYAPNNMEFWRLVIENFMDIVCLLLHSLVNDEGMDTLTIFYFRNEIMKGPWLFPEKRDLLRQTLSERKFDETLNGISKRVNEIRTNQVAHQLIDRQSGSPQDAVVKVSFNELKMLFYATQNLFGALSFGAAFVTLVGDLIPGTIGRQPTRTCLDDVLDKVLRDSHFVNQPERRAQWWPVDREHMDAKELQLMNKLRKRIGLPEK